MESIKAKNSADSAEISAADRLDTIYKESIDKLGLTEKKQEKAVDPIDAERYKENVHNNAAYEEMLAKLKKRRSQNKSIWTDEPVIPVRKSIWLDDEPEQQTSEPPKMQICTAAEKSISAEEIKPEPPTKRTVEITIRRPTEKPTKKKRLIRRRKG